MSLSPKKLAFILIKGRTLDLYPPNYSVSYISDVKGVTKSVLWLFVTEIIAVIFAQKRETTPRLSLVLIRFEILTPFWKSGVRIGEGGMNLGVEKTMVSGGSFRKSTCFPPSPALKTFSRSF